MWRVFVIAWFSVCWHAQWSYGQAPEEILTLRQFVQSVIDHHPKAALADIRIDMAQAKLLETKGKFDPVLKSDLGEKFFTDKLYYHKYQTDIRIPTPIGLDIVTGYQKNYGNFLNPESKTDKNGLWNLNFELDVLQGLIRSERRISLAQAKVDQDIAINEKDLALNDLIFDACYTYLQWQMVYFYNVVLVENRDLARRYFDITKETYSAGEKTAMDTLEAFIAYQDADILLQKNIMELTKMHFLLYNFMWADGQAIPQTNTLVPQAIDASEREFSASMVGDVSLESNPVLMAYENKLKILELDLLLKREKLKPKLKLKYNALLSTDEGAFSPAFAAQDYVYGFYFSMPLYLRSERGAINQGKWKIKETELQFADKKNQISNAAENYKLQLYYVQSQISLLTANISNYKNLLDSEGLKFELGESSVFLLNKRQEKYIEAQLKLIAELLKLQTTQLNYLYYTNTISRLVR